MLSHKLYVTSRIAVVILYFIIIIELLRQGEIERLVFFSLNCILFFGVSVKYEKKRIHITPGYVFLFTVVFLVSIVASTYYTESQLAEEANYYVGVPGDHFFLYSTVSIIFLLLCLMYLETVEKDFNYSKSLNVESFQSGYEISMLTIGTLICLPISLIRENLAIVYVPVMCYFMLDLLVRRKLNRQILIAFLGFCCWMIRYARFRYLFVELLLPILLAGVIVLGNKQVSYKKYIAAITFAVVVVLGYGVFSELYKLSFYNSIYTFESIIHNIDAAIYFVYRQLYRLFGIWIRLGGNIIEHAQKNGFFYGLTYIKSISGIIGLPYVSLPEISAGYVQASYAQPGLIAEGYANFGWLGSLINLGIPFIIAEYLYNNYVRTLRPEWLCICIIPFSKVFIDGGTVNSVLFGIFVCFLAFILLLGKLKIIARTQ